MFHAVIVDTDILIDVARGIDEAVQCLKRYEGQPMFVISIITKMELIVGCRDNNELRHTERFLQRFQILNINETISMKATQLLLQYRLSHGLLIADAFIASTAICWNYPLISKNQRDYRFISELNLLRYP
jgi:hypothetical protein